MKAVYTVHWGGQRADDIKRQQPPTLVLTGTLIHSNKRGIDCGLYVRGLMNGFWFWFPDSFLITAFPEAASPTVNSPQAPPSVGRTSGFTQTHGCGGSARQPLPRGI